CTHTPRARVPRDHPRSGRAVPYHLTRGAFAEQIRSRLSAPASRAGVPLAIHAARRGDFGPFLAPLRSGGGGPAIAEGLYLSVTCAEDVPFIPPAEAE